MLTQSCARLAEGRRLAFFFVPLLLAGVGCGFGGLKKDVEEMETVGLVSGTVTAPGGTDGVFVQLFAETDGRLSLAGTNELTELMDTWAFTINTGVRYYLAGFSDLDGDRRWSPGEPAGLLGADKPFVPGEQIRVHGVRLELKADIVIPERFTLDAGDTAIEDNAGLKIVAGEIIDFDDPRFSAEQASDGMWAPLTELRASGTGIYFLEPYDPQKVPVLFVHGLGGSPAEFRFLARSLDLERFQPWFFHYPSGFRLHSVGRTLYKLVGALHGKLGFDSICVVAHSMGGLVSRSCILQAHRNPRYRGVVKLLVTIATPLQGHAAAEFGLKYTPEPVPAWIDMAPGSGFLRNISQPLPEGLAYCILFTYNRGGRSLMNESHDTVVSVASQLPRWAQEEAARLRGFDEDHVSILAAEEAADELNRILDEVAPSPPFLAAMPP